MARHGRAFPIKPHLGKFSVYGGGTIVTGDVTETLTLTDAQTATATFAATITESISLAETQSATGTFVAAQTETLNLSDTQTATLTFGSDVSDTLNFSDACDATVTPTPVTRLVQGWPIGPRPYPDFNSRMERRRERITRDDDEIMEVALLWLARR